MTTEASVTPITRAARWRDAIVADSPSMRTLLDLIERVAPSPLSVVLHGETGSGKEVAARGLHAASRRHGRLVAFNCAAVPASLAESELFGHVRGAFTGAEANHPGLFREAHTGTLLLDEVGELDLTIQAKLLRALEDGLIRPVGGVSASQVDVRVIAASHQDLDLAVEKGRFRADLYHRLAGVTLTVPPLRERLEDITALALAFLAEAAPERSMRIALDAWEWLRSQSWPGNVRELRQTIHRAVALGGDRLTIEDFTRLAPMRHRGVPSLLDEWLASKSWLEVEAEVIRWAIARHGSVRRAALALRRPHSTMADRVKRLGLDRPAER